MQKLNQGWKSHTKIKRNSKGSRIVEKKYLSEYQHLTKPEKIVLEYLKRKSFQHSPRLKDRKNRESIIQSYFSAPGMNNVHRNISGIAKILSKLHTQSLNRFGRIRNRHKGNYYDYFIHQAKGSSSSINSLLTHNNTSVKKLYSFLSDAISNAENEIEPIREQLSKISKFSLLHLDMSKSNLLQGKRTIYLVDWGSSRVGDPAHEIANFFLLNNLTKSEEHLFLLSYGKATLDFQKRIQLFKIIALAGNIGWYGDPKKCVITTQNRKQVIKSFERDLINLETLTNKKFSKDEINRIKNILFNI